MRKLLSRLFTLSNVSVSVTFKSGLKVTVEKPIYDDTEEGQEDES